MRPLIDTADLKRDSSGPSGAESQGKRCIWPDAQELAAVNSFFGTPSRAIVQQPIRTCPVRWVVEPYGDFDGGPFVRVILVDWKLWVNRNLVGLPHETERREQF